MVGLPPPLTARTADQAERVESVQMVVKGGCADAEGVGEVSSISTDARFCQQMLLE
jgi:hypothetical protein